MRSGTVPSASRGRPILACSHIMGACSRCLGVRAPAVWGACLLPRTVSARAAARMCAAWRCNRPLAHACRYWPADFYDLNHAFGDAAAMKAMIADMQQKGIWVMADMVYNHVGWVHQGPSQGLASVMMTPPCLSWCGSAPCAGPARS